MDEPSLERAVYVMRLNPAFAIKYLRGISPVIYIGEGNFKNRIISHKGWVSDLPEVIDSFSLTIGLSIPRV